MVDYVLVYNGGAVPEGEEAQQAVMAAWGEWYEKLGPAIVDGGNPFGPSMTVSADGSRTEGAASGLTGYTIVSADSLSAAADHAAGCPVLTDGGRVDVYETFDARQAQP